MEEVIEVARMRKNLAATGSIVGASSVAGVFVSQASATPTLKVADGGGVIMNTLTPLAGTYYPFPCKVTGTVTVTISGTVDCTVFYS